MGRIIHFEIPTDNAQKSMEFYKNIFGWTFQNWGDSDYWLADTGKKDDPGINGAITKRQENIQNVVNTILVSDIEETIPAISNNGGIVLTPVMDIPKVGKFLYFKDPDGNIMGALQGGMD
jgi:predicted enzyme related to lactoylglutathione lyase